MFTSLINLSARQSWREFGPSSDAQPPPFNTYIPSHKEHIPHSSCRKDTHLPLSQIPAMFSGNVALSFCVPPLRRPRPPLTRAKNATNYWGSRQWSLSFNPWQVLLGYYQDVNGRDRAVWHSRDCEGFRGAHLHERALLHQLCFDITYCWIFIKRRNHFGSKSFQNQTKNTQRWFWHKKFLCALCGGYTSPKWGVMWGDSEDGTRMRYYIPHSSIRQTWDDVREAARGCSGTVHSYLHRWTLLALTWQPSGSSNTKHTASNDRSADQW